MNTLHRAAVAAGFTLALACGPARAAGPYPTMAPIEAYRLPSVQAEIALARTAAPPSISNDAEVMVLGDKGYETAVKGKNGFLCLVERSWANELDDAGFWNPRLRAPICFNAASARSVVPPYLERTRLVLAGVDRTEIAARQKAETAAGRIPPPEIGAMCFMMSKDGYLNDDVAGPWRPHLMYFLPRSDPAAWGADRPGSPVMSATSAIPPMITFMVPVTNWSDGSPAAPMKM